MVSDVEQVKLKCSPAVTSRLLNALQQSEEIIH